MTTGERLHEVREYLCVSVEYAATVTGLMASDILAMENDARAIVDLDLQRLARAYAYPASYFRAEGTGVTDFRATGIPRVTADLTDHDANEVGRFTAFLRDSADR